MTQTEWESIPGGRPVAVGDKRFVFVDGFGEFIGTVLSFTEDEITMNILGFPEFEGKTIQFFITGWVFV